MYGIAAVHNTMHNLYLVCENGSLVTKFVSKTYFFKTKTRSLKK